MHAVENTGKDNLLDPERLFKTIANHPDWRVVGAVPGSTDSCHPLKFFYSEDAFVFADDASATALHPHGTCNAILNLLGEEELPEKMAGSTVVVGDMYCESAEDVYKDGDFRIVKGMSLDPSAQWIKLKY